jgi:hypothetical protein
MLSINRHCACIPNENAIRIKAKIFPIVLKLKITSSKLCDFGNRINAFVLVILNMGLP